ncbi:hypothetical protein [Raineya sp.]|jgi:hypothetical protein
MRKNIFTLAIIAFALFACKKQEKDTEKKSEEKQEQQAQQNNEQEKENSTLISCEGIGRVKFSMNYADLEKAFGKENIKSDTVFAGTEMMDGEKTDEDRIYSTISSPEGKIYVTWAAGKVAKEIEKISIGIADKPKFKFANGISVGSSFNDIRKANTNGDFEFYGMGWEYGGLIINETATGDFFKNFPCFTGDLRTKDDTYDKVQKIMGDGKYKASKVGETEANELILAHITLLRKK